MPRVTNRIRVRIIDTSTIQQERLQAIAEKRKRQTEMENKRRQLEDDRRQLEKELELLENGISASSTKENMAEETRESAKEEKLQLTPKTPVGSAKVESKVSNSPMKAVDSGGMMKAVVHAVRTEDGALENGLHQLSSSEVDELIHKADEVTLSEVSEKVKDLEEARSHPASQKDTPRKEITGVQAKPMESPKMLASGEGPEPSKEQPVTMIFMGYQNVEDENETKKVLGLEGTIKAELVVIGDAENKPVVDSTEKNQAPPNGSAVEPVTAIPQKEENQAGENQPPASNEPKSTEQDIETKKQRCKCCSVM
ncbi:hypothetical protein JD844_033960 [Phrynosoma platyrhinos]|uniref:Paralemmin-1 n=1 Tax=Phrynosoma platyrhinos TaxID=52577 RepID=A0ABQ7T8I0_PHRPL|nr:hypothetical protein JD844_033960 [Phrynosoma platyrhinos]